MPAPSATSSSVCPGLGATRVLSGTKVTSGALAARRASVRTPTPATVPAGAAAARARPPPAPPARPPRRPPGPPRRPHDLLLLAHGPHEPRDRQRDRRRAP